MTFGRVRTLPIVVAMLAMASSACLDNELAQDADTAGGAFIALRGDFEDFEDWEKYSSDVMNEHGGVIGTTNIYLTFKREPLAEDATEFPVGTMLVKTMQASDSDELNIHAMVKRGGGFNPKGALGWEYFELALAKADGSPYWLWRGEKPPAGEEYMKLLGAADLAPRDAEASCNSCHAEPDAKDGTFDEIAELLK